MLTTGLGREITLPPVRAHTWRKRRTDMYKLWDALIEEAKIEAKLYKNEHMYFMLNNMTGKTIQVAECNLIRRYLKL